MPNKLKRIYVVEMWSNELICSAHETLAVHYASSLKKAKKWCKEHSNYGGKPKDYGYFSWHWKIFEQFIDEDQCCVINAKSGRNVTTIKP